MPRKLDHPTRYRAKCTNCNWTCLLGPHDDTYNIGANHSIYYGHSVFMERQDYRRVYFIRKALKYAALLAISEAGESYMGQ